MFPPGFELVLLLFTPQGMFCALVLILLFILIFK